MTTMLGDFVKTRSRFSRSANVERDHGYPAIDGYVPTGRALDVISRVAYGLSDPSAGRTFSITGPHGSGKSSLAVFLDGLLADSRTAEFKSSHAVLKSVDASVDAQLRAGMRVVRTGGAGFIRAFATARYEPIAATVARALYGGVVRQLGREQDLVPTTYGSETQSEDDIRACIRRVTHMHPVLLVIDEFGKNLEHFAATGSEGDPFLLQELAEMTQGAGAVPMVVITMQHLSFEEYVNGSSTARRREWSKVQGRFQDIPYIETPTQSRRLIASALEQSQPLKSAANRWVAEHRSFLAEQGLRDIAEDAASGAPLHPLALAVLPDLCGRYGQNERTLFSFLTGAEPSALPRYLRSTPWDPGGAEEVPLAGLDLLYDYFLESSSSMIGVADGASRWMEIETRIRDNAGLTAGQLKVLKTIGLLNLVAGGGRIRASRALLKFAVGAHLPGALDLDAVLASLIDRGLITYRTFSDEYRIWQGSDYDLCRVIENARRTLEAAELADLLEAAVKLEPLVAGRHSQRTGVLRVFARQFCGRRPAELGVLDPAWDGIVFYATDSSTEPSLAPQPTDGRPAVYVVPEDFTAVREAATDAAALTSALRSAELEGADWVARQELVERAASAQQRLQAVIGQTWDTRAEWLLAGDDESLNPRLGLSALLSDVADKVYSSTPHIANEMIARRELTSQGAKARRFLTDALLAHQGADAFGIEGYGPERAIYEAVFRKTGIHRVTDDNVLTLRPPTDRSWRTVWALMNSAFDGADQSRLSLAEVALQMKLPPVGLKDGIIPLILITGLVVRADDVALYEHGSLVLHLDDAVAERLTKNLGHFSVKNTQTKSGKRSALVKRLSQVLNIDGASRAAAPTFLNVIIELYRRLRRLPPYSQKAKQGLSPEAIAVREAFQLAAEPDVLLFKTLPEIFGLSMFGGRSRIDWGVIDKFVRDLTDAIDELEDAYSHLLRSVKQQLAQATSTSGSLADIRQALAADAARLEGYVLEPRLKSFVGGLSRKLDDQAWLENVAMVISEGQAPRTWTDDVAGRFALRVTELGGALRRTTALLHERLATNLTPGYVANRMTLTRPDGTESIQTLVLTEPERAVIDPLFEDVIDVLAAGGMSRSAACRMLMARLAMEQLSVAQELEGQSSDREGRHYA